MEWNDPNLIKTLNAGGIVVMPTDTLYGIVGGALDEKVVNRIYTARKRNPEKPCIILIGDVAELEKFSIILIEEQKRKVLEFWSPGSRPTSIVLDCDNPKFEYLHRGTKTLAFRLSARNASRSDAGGPASGSLRNLLMQTGPLIAPSANLEALPSSENIDQAKKYFGNLVDLYVDGGEVKGQASKVIRLQKDGSVSILRQ
jgi:L-threonylcarbamoyladenylate synthase